MRNKMNRTGKGTMSSVVVVFSTFLQYGLNNCINIKIATVFKQTIKPELHGIRLFGTCFLTIKNQFKVEGGERMDRLWFVTHKCPTRNTKQYFQQLTVQDVSPSS